MPILDSALWRDRLTRPIVRQVGLTAIFTGYFAVWLPGPGAGLSLTGLEVGEWIKFMGVGRLRHLFYLPPITLSIMLAATTLTGTPSRWRGRAMRGLAAAVALLALPAIDSIRLEPAAEWWPRLALVAVALLWVVAAGRAAGRLAPQQRRGLSALLFILLGLVGGILPGWAYAVVRPLVEEALRSSLGNGPGLWLNTAGHLLATAAGLAALTGRPRLE